MTKDFTLEYWVDEGWYVGRLLEAPGIFSQGESLEELEENIQDAFKLMLVERPKPKRKTQSKRVVIQV
jgi:predicted RNase H-like HicB family nuclease